MLANQLLQFDHVACAYDASPVIENVDLSFDRSDFVGVVGPSGSGKTTLLRSAIGSVTPVHGQLRRAPGLRVGYVPQVESVDWNFPVTVEEVVIMPLVKARWWPRTSPAERRQAGDVLDRLGLEGLAERHIRELSGGQQQRVFLARAIIQRPDILVLDEPTSGVDVRTRHEILHVLSDLHRDGIAVLLTTHDINGLAAHLPRLVCFNRTVIADGPPGAVLKPYFLERTFGAPMEVLEHGGVSIVLDAPLRLVGRDSA